MAYEPSENSDQPGHPPCLIRVFAVHMKKPCVLSYSLSVKRRFWSDWADVKKEKKKMGNFYLEGMVVRNNVAEKLAVLGCPTSFDFSRTSTYVQQVQYR